jgi:hypothetical protein
MLSRCKRGSFEAISGKKLQIEVGNPHFSHAKTTVVKTV